MLETRARLCLTTAPDPETAERLARGLVEQGFAACVNILAPCRSVYRWQGAVQDETEIPLLIKTTAAAYPALETWLRAQHPYELPEIVALEIEQGLPDYLRWLADATQP